MAHWRTCTQCRVSVQIFFTVNSQLKSSDVSQSTVLYTYKRISYYRAVWMPYIGETLPCFRELTNGHNPFTVKASQLHGNRWNDIYRTQYAAFFLRKGGTISTIICRNRTYSSNLVGLDKTTWRIRFLEVSQQSHYPFFNTRYKSDMHAHVKNAMPIDFNFR